METKPLKTIQFPGNDSVYEIHDAVARGDAAKAAKTVNGQAPDATGDVKLDLAMSTTEAVEKYMAENPPKSEPGQAATLQITGADALPAGSDPTVTEEAGSTAQNRVYRLGIPAGANGTSPAISLSRVEENGRTGVQIIVHNSGTDAPQMVLVYDGENGAPGSNGKSAYQYAQDGGYTGTEEELAAKLAQEKFANPNALFFTGAVNANYDGSEPLTVNIPSSAGGSGGSGGLPNWRLIKTLACSSEIAFITFSEDDNGEAFAVKEIMIVGTVPGLGSGYLSCGIGTGATNAVWPTAGKIMRWWLASVNGTLKTMLVTSDTAVGGGIDRNTSCPSDIVTIEVGASAGFTEAGTLYVYGR